MGEKKKKTKNTTYEFVCKAHDLTEEREIMMYDYIQLLNLVSKYDMDERDTKRIVEIVYEYLGRNWRW